MGSTVNVAKNCTLVMEKQSIRFNYIIYPGSYNDTKVLTYEAHTGQLVGKQTLDQNNYNNLWHPET